MGIDSESSEENYDDIINSKTNTEQYDKSNQESNSDPNDDDNINSKTNTEQYDKSNQESNSDSNDDDNSNQKSSFNKNIKNSSGNGYKRRFGKVELDENGFVKFVTERVLMIKK